jgi:hypothetical protein
MRVLVGLGGLVGLLIVVFFIVWMQAESASTVIPAGNEARQAAEQIAGRDQNGKPISQTITLEPVYRGGQLQAMAVSALDANGPMSTYFGLKVGDQITQVGPLEVSGMNDAGLAKAEVDEAYQKMMPLVVTRDGQKVKLPAASPPAASVNQQGPAPAAAPSPANRTDTRSPLQRQLDAVRNIPTH